MSLRYTDILKASTPVAAGYLSLGLTFGIMFSQIGGTPVESFIISLLCFAGAAQFLALTYYVSEFNSFSFFFALLVLNLRHIFYTIEILPEIRNLKTRFYLVGALTDENFATWKILRGQLESQQFWKAFLTNHFYWVAGCTLGCLIPKSILNQLKGLDFALTALFVLLFTSQLKEMRRKNLC